MLIEVLSILHLILRNNVYFFHLCIFILKLNDFVYLFLIVDFPRICNVSLFALFQYCVFMHIVSNYQSKYLLIMVLMV